MPRPRPVLYEWTAYLRGKLGGCSRCMRLSGRGALGSWLAAALLIAVSAPAAVVFAAGFAALAFSALALSHATAFLVKYVTGSPCRSCGADEQVAWEGSSDATMPRRAVLAGALSAAAGLLGFLSQAQLAEALGKCKPNFKVGHVVQQGKDACTFTYGVDVTCDCTGTCDKDSTGKRPPCERDASSPLTYAWTFALKSGTAAAGALNGALVTVTVTNQASYELQVAVGGCKCCCLNTTDCKTAPAEASKAKTFKVTCVAPTPGP